MENKIKKSGRPPGIKKTEVILGYRYTEEEANIIRSVIEKLKNRGLTTSKAILTVFKNFKRF